MNWVWPRLDPATAETLYRELQEGEAEELRERSALEHHHAAPVAVGGTPVPVERVRMLQEELRSLADDLGFPEPLARPSVSRFDRPATKTLHDVMQIVPADAASSAVWDFVTLVVLPDVAVWRFPDRARNRIFGHQRNVFRRLWARAETVGVDIIDIESGLGEDEFVNIMERTSIASDRRISRALAEEIIRSPAGFGGARSELMRDAAKRVLRLQASLCMEVLEDHEVERHVAAAVAQSVDAMAGVD